MTPVAQLTVKEDLCRRILDLPAEVAEQLSRYLDDLEAHEPNEETIAALREAENLENLTTCADLQDMLKKCGVRC
jgi:hypothetical protein